MPCWAFLQQSSFFRMVEIGRLGSLNPQRWFVDCWLAGGSIDGGGPSSCLALRHSTVGNNIIKTGRLCWFRGWLSSAALPNRKNGIPHSKPIGFIQSQCQWNQEKGGGVEEVSQPPQVKGHLNKSSQLNTFPDNVAPTPVFFLLPLPVSPTCGGSAPPLRGPSPDASDSMPLIK